MNRLTEKINNYYFSKDKINADHNIELNKLGQLEDIEEELGIDLITLFKALKNGIYSTYGNHFYKVVYLTTFGGEEYCIEHDDEEEFRFSLISRKTKDYGKTWALTKEELK